MLDDDTGFRTGTSMNAVEPTQDSDVGDSLDDPASGSVGGNVSGPAGGALILNADPGTPASVSGAPATSSIGGSQQQPGAPPQKPSFFKGLITQLGLALAQGTKAGLQAPRSAQGPSIAAQKAIAMPQEDLQAKTKQSMDQMNIAMTQVKLHQMTMIAHKMEQDQAEGVYGMNRDAYMEMVKSKVMVPQATGTLKEIQDLYTQKQADYKAQGGTGLLNLHVAAAPGGSLKDNNGQGSYALYQVETGRTEKATPIDFDYTDLGYDAADLKAAGLPTKFHAVIGAGAKNEDVATLPAKYQLDAVTRIQPLMEKYQQNKVTVAARAEEGKANRENRLDLQEMRDKTSSLATRSTSAYRSNIRLP
jgi:hypothetical protein